MRLFGYFLPGLAALLLAAPPAPAADSPDPGKSPDADRDVLALAATINEEIAKHWAAENVRPAPPADDAEFVRRVYLDLAGRIPSVHEARDFLDDKAADKRLRLVQRLLAGPRYVTHFTRVWRSLLLPEENSNFQARFVVPGFESWLRGQLTKNAGYDQMVRELLTASSGDNNNQGKVFFGFGPQTASPFGFYLAKDLKPENLAASTARLFLGIRLECAQCHNHPFANWKREQFWSYAAFFAGLSRQGQGDFVVPGREMTDRRELTIPGTDQVVQARFPDGKEPKWKFKASARDTLADWVTSADNPYFARAAVNRTWAYFFGTGLIDPVDEMVGAEHPASHPELLDELARQFAAHKFDLKFLIQAITASRPYQLTSARTDPSQDEPRLFARMPLRGLSAEQLYDSVAEATGFQDGSPQLPPGVVVLGPGSPRAEFVAKFTNRGEKSTEVQTSILQALSLMNGRLVADATSLERSETLASVADAPFMDTAQRIETLYLAALTRKPTARELNRLVRYVESGGPAEDGTTSADKEKRYQLALADVFWTLLNSGEFFLNH
jgi:hypothetical protein